MQLLIFVLLAHLGLSEQSVGDCLSEPPAPRCEGDTLVTFVEPGTADSRGCMVYGREENDCAVGHCNAAAGKCDEITANAPIPCSSMIGEDWACMGCWQNEGNACTAKKWGSPTPIEGVCNSMFGCVKASNGEEAVGVPNHIWARQARVASRIKAQRWKFLESDRCEVKTDEECPAGEKEFLHSLKKIYYCCDLSLEQSLSNPLPEEVETGSASCYEKQANTGCAYTVGSLYIANGKAYSIANEASCKEVCDASSDCVAFQYVHSGQHSGGPMKLGTGTCYYMGGKLYGGTSVDHNRSCYVKKECDDGADVKCDWVSGDGSGNGEIKHSETITGIQCAEECYKRGGFNGATVKANGGNGCWCERSMNNIQSSSTYKTCYLRPKPDITCNWVTGDGTGKGETKISEVITGEACAIECHRRGGYNGATVFSNGDYGCWCEKGMNAIRSSSTQYKTCYINTATESEQALSNPLTNALLESSLSQTTKLPDIITYIFAAVGFLSVLYVGAKHGSKAFSGGDYAEV